MKATRFKVCAFFAYATLTVYPTNALQPGPNPSMPSSRVLEYNLHVKAYSGSTTEKPSFFKSVSDSFSDALVNSFGKLKNYFTSDSEEEPKTVYVMYPGSVLGPKVPQVPNVAIKKTPAYINPSGRLVAKEVLAKKEQATGAATSGSYLDVKLTVKKDNGNEARKHPQGIFLAKLNKVLGDSVNLQTHDS